MSRLSGIANKVRIDIIRMMEKSGSSHIGSCFSIVDILQVLYYEVMNIYPDDPKNEERDIFILSKAHASAALYATLARRGFFPLNRLQEYYINGGTLPGHLDRELVPGIENSAGSLGHGLPVGLGMALSRINDNIDTRVYVLLGDGETDEGSVWEAVTFAGNHRISNLTLIIDNNKLQGLPVTGNHSCSFVDKLESFGWDCKSVDGHDFKLIRKALSRRTNKPIAIIANTIKGKGVSFMENKLEWHYRSPDKDLTCKALEELSKNA